MRLDCRALDFYVYYSHQKIAQLYRQLPESRRVAEKCSVNRSGHLELGLQPREPRGEPCLKVGAVANSGTESRYSELCVEKNEMYQWERVLARLRKSGQLCVACAGETPCPGQYYEVQGCFSPDDEAQAPEHYVWLRAPASACGPALRLLCHKHCFCGEHERSAFAEAWACGAPLPLRGVVVCLSGGENALCGLPLALIC